MIAPANASHAPDESAVQPGDRAQRQLTPEEQRRGLAAMERVGRIEAEVLARRGGMPFSPAAWELLGEARDERIQQLDDLR